MKKLLAWIAMLTALAVAGQSSIKTPLVNPYLLNNMDGRQESATNFWDFSGDVFTLNGISITNWTDLTNDISAGVHVGAGTNTVTVTNGAAVTVNVPTNAFDYAGAALAASNALNGQITTATNTTFLASSNLTYQATNGLGTAAFTPVGNYQATNQNLTTLATNNGVNLTNIASAALPANLQILNTNNGAALTNVAGSNVVGVIPLTTFQKYGTTNIMPAAALQSLTPSGFVATSGTSGSPSNYNTLNGGPLTNINPATAIAAGTLILTNYNNSEGLYDYGNINGFFEINIQNDSAGASASSDVVATMNTNFGTASQYYVDIGINSSAYSGVWGAPGDSYLYAQGTNNNNALSAPFTNNLWLGTAQSNANIFFSVGNGGNTATATLSTNSTFTVTNVNFGSGTVTAGPTGITNTGTAVGFGGSGGGSLGSNGMFVTTNINLIDGTAVAVSIPHGLGVLPQYTALYLRCVTNDSTSGMVVGQQIDATVIRQATASAFNVFAEYPDANNLNIYYDGRAGSAATFTISTAAGQHFSSFNNFQMVCYYASNVLGGAQTYFPTGSTNGGIVVVTNSFATNYVTATNTITIVGGVTNTWPSPTNLPTISSINTGIFSSGAAGGFLPGSTMRDFALVITNGSSAGNQGPNQFILTLTFPFPITRMVPTLVNGDTNSMQGLNPYFTYFVQGSSTTLNWYTGTVAPQQPIKGSAITTNFIHMGGNF